MHVLKSGFVLPHYEVSFKEIAALESTVVKIFQHDSFVLEISSLNIITGLGPDDHSTLE